jgi:hypothetical protein
LIEINRETTGTAIGVVPIAPVGILEANSTGSGLLITGNSKNIIATRNNLRSICVEFCNQQASPSYFSISDLCIRIADFPGACYTILCINSEGALTTDYLSNPPHLKLFHEMLHWFHYLRNPQRTTNGISASVQDFEAVDAFAIAQAHAFLAIAPTIFQAIPVGACPLRWQAMFQRTAVKNDAFVKALLKLAAVPLPSTAAERRNELKKFPYTKLQDLVRLFINSAKRSYIFSSYYCGLNDTTYWGGSSESVRGEEMRTILGSPAIPGAAVVLGEAARLSILPDTIWQYCEGDDLSENAYRKSLGLCMRWGHTGAAIKPIAFTAAPPTLTNAHAVANNCCANIGKEANCHRWGFTPHEAIFSGE